MEAFSRTEKVIITAQGIVLKKLREESGLSMVEAGERIGAIAERGKKFSATYISQVENHRTAPPSGDTLRAFLEVYKISAKHFQKRCRQWKNKLTDDEYIKNTIVSAFYLSITLAENLSINNLIEIGKNAFVIIGMKIAFGFVWNIFEIYLIYIITKKICKIFNINFSNSRIFSVSGNSIEVSNKFGNETPKNDEKSDLIKHKEDLVFIASKNENIFLKLINSILALKKDSIKNEIVENKIKEIYEFIAQKEYTSQDFEILLKKSKKYEVKESEAESILKKVSLEDKTLIIKGLFKVIIADTNYFGKNDLAIISLIGDT